MVVGGFPRSRNKQALKAAGCSYAIIQPKITKLDGNGSNYLSLFAQEPVPLEQVFQTAFLALYWTAVGTLGESQGRIFRPDLRCAVIKPGRRFRTLFNEQREKKARSIGKAAGGRFFSAAEIRFERNTVCFSRCGKAPFHSYF